MDPHIIELLNTAGLFLVAVVSYFGNKATHKLVNSRMTELLELTKQAALAAGAKEEADRANPPKDSK